MNQGPTEIIVKPKYTCSGCAFLKLNDWKFYGEDDDTDSGEDDGTDSGTDARCTKTENIITSY